MPLDLFDPHELPKIFHIKVIPNAKKVQIKKLAQTDSNLDFKIYVNAPAEDGKANKAVIQLLAKELGIAKSRIKILKGELNREKEILISELV